MKVSSFAVDVDGTITDYGGVVSQDAAFTLKWLERVGFKVILVSGRGSWDIYPLSASMGITRVGVAENGGVVVFSPLDLMPLTDKSASLLAYETLCREIGDLKLAVTSPRITEVVLQRTFDVKDAQKILDDHKVPVRINDSGFAYHLTHNSINKAAGLLAALKYLGLKCSETVAIGDSVTDVPMFECCGYSIALANASRDVRDKASYTTSSQMGEGLVEAVQHVVDRFFKVDLEAILNP